MDVEKQGLPANEMSDVSDIMCITECIPANYGKEGETEYLFREVVGAREMRTIICREFVTKRITFDSLTTPLAKTSDFW